MVNDKRLNVLSKEERAILYDLPNLVENDQIEYFVFTEKEQNVMFSHKNISTQIYCGLQIAYFKAKKCFFKFSWNEVSEKDITFLVENYFKKKLLLKNLLQRMNIIHKQKKLLNYMSIIFGIKNIYPICIYI